MYHLNLNMPLLVFLVGVMLFLFAPIESVSTYSTQEISMAGLLIELTGIISGLIVFYRYKITERTIKEI